MKLLADAFPTTAWSRRWFWLRHRAHVAVESWKNPPGDPGKNFKVLPEFGGWTVRPEQGWRRHRWVSPPLHYTRSASDRDTAGDWALKRMGIG